MPLYSNFNEILTHQIENKQWYNNKKNIFGNEMINIEIKENLIHNIRDGIGFIHPTRKMQYIKLIENVLNKYKIPDGNININLSDIPKHGCFNFCRFTNDPKCFLLPDFRFTFDDIKINDEWKQIDNPTFKETSEFLQKLHDKYDFDTKIKKIYTSCIPHQKKLDYFRFSLNNLDICMGHMYGGSGHKYNRTPHDLVSLLEANGLASTEHKNFEEHFKYKYILYNDGNTLSNRMKLLLNTNSVILRQNSQYEEIYTYLLKDKINYISYTKSDELRSIYNILENDPDLCLQIIKNNKNFVKNIITYENILEYTAILLQNLL